MDERVVQALVKYNTGLKKQPWLMPIPGEKLELLLQNYGYKDITAQAGFVFNGASIPRIFWITTGTPFDPQYEAGALIHDWIYQKQKHSRKYADQLFREILLANGVSKYQANKIYYAVRVFGWLAWHNNKKRLREES
jgi:hypothetical protein